MPLKRWKKISEHVLFDNSWWMYKKDVTELPNGNCGQYHYVHTRGASMIVPVLDDGRIVLVNQFRYLNNRESLEFPCGGVKEGHSYEETAAHELEEEAGFAFAMLRSVGSFNPYNGVTDEICRVFLAQGLREVDSHPDETEEFEKILLHPNEIDEKIMSGEIWDGMTIASWGIAKAHFV